MKKLTGFSLFVFFCVVSAILTAGLVFTQNNNSKNIANINNSIQKDLANLVSAGVSQLDLNEIAKHNKMSDCWMLINGKVYDITSYFGSHPGGNSTMLATCGKDATDAYKTKDPNATTSGSSTAHSSRARSLLDNYYIGDLNQKIDAKTIQANAQKAKTVVAPKSSGGEDD